MTSITEPEFSKMSNDHIAALYLQGLQVYEDQIDIMEYVRRKSIEVRNDLVEIEAELKKRKIEVKTIEEEEEDESATSR